MSGTIQGKYLFPDTRTTDERIADVMQQMIYDYPYASPSNRIVLAAQFNLCAKHMAADGK